MRCVLLANGPSLTNADLSRVTLPVFGMNRSWKVCPDPAYQVCLETAHAEAAPEFYERMHREGKLYVAGTKWTGQSGWKIGKVLTPGHGTFSRDVFKDGVVCELNGVGSVFYAALQVAYTLGFREVLALGLDLVGDHFDGSPASPHVERQNELFAHVPEDMRVMVAGSQESRAQFQKVNIEEVYA